jgi:hypothetical protein
MRRVPVRMDDVKYECDPVDDFSDRDLSCEEICDRRTDAVNATLAAGTKCKWRFSKNGKSVWFESV